MLRYILRRSAYSILIVIGVLLLTFVLFRVAAGDPAATVLGKNPSPSELEALRNELGSNKPLLIGGWQKTEEFSTLDIASGRPLRGFSCKGRYEEATGSLKLAGGAQIIFSRNFKGDGKDLRCELLYKGVVKAGGQELNASVWKHGYFYLPPAANEFMIEARADGTELKLVEFYQKQDSVFDTQFANSLIELVSLKKEFPYLSFFNFGKTLITREEISGILWRGVWPSLFLMVPVFFGELIAGIVLALLSTAFRGKWIDKSILLVSVAGMSVSYLVFIIYGQWYLGYYYNIFPVWGYGSIKYLALPVIIGIISGVGGGVRFYRTVFVNELNREYLRTALAKGCSSYKIYFGHLLRNAFIPIISRAASTIPFLFTGSLLLETFFGIPGLGFAGINALMNSDLQMLKALVILSAIMFVIINLLADIAYAWADPRVRFDR